MTPAPSSVAAEPHASAPRRAVPNSIERTNAHGPVIRPVSRPHRRGAPASRTGRLHAQRAAPKPPKNARAFASRLSR
ncbi:hypothetical protein WL92_14405 [Burkholderia multivorans]|nr:hypothetical protein WL91_07995 [Burkholderia multivorans]KWF79419.1 hypothetical protein WL92_14405 [Burkholderia multivorans]